MASIRNRIFLWSALALALILFSGFAFASYSVSIPDFVKMYGPGATLQGTLNLSIANESADLLMNASFNDIVKSISVMDLLKNAGVNYSCDPSDCVEKYSKSGAGVSKTLGTGTGYLALVVENGKEVTVQSVSFNLSGSGGVESCGSPPIGFDLLNDGSVDWYYSESSENRCYGLSEGKGRTYGGGGGYEAVLTDSPYCEKINLERAGRFELGVDMANGSGAAVHLSIIDGDSGDEASCEANATEGMTSCMVNFTSPTKKDYYVCASSSVESNHKIRSEIQSPTCGYGFSSSEDFRSFQCNETSTDYGIYATPMKIVSFNNTVTFDQNSFLSSDAGDLTSYVQNYIDSRYGGNCNQSCVVPIRFDLIQNVVLSGLNFRYSATGLGTRNQQSFYDSARIPAKMSADGQIQLSDSKITVPSTSGRYSFVLKIGDRTVKEISINVEEVPRINSLTPTEIQALVPATFSVDVSSPKNNSIEKYYWNYGDESSDETTVPSTNHTYGIGTFKMTVEATDSEGLVGTGTFNIMATAPTEDIGATLKRKRANIDVLKDALLKIPSWYSALVVDQLGLSKISSDLAILETDFARVDADYPTIKNSLDYFVVYSAIKDDDVGSSPVAATVDISYFEPMGEVIPSGRDAEISSALNEWNRNVMMKVTYLVKYAQSDISSDSNLDLATIADITVDSNYAKNTYFIVKLPAGMNASELRFNSNYSFISVNDAVVFSLENLQDREIELAIPGRQLELQMFASPPISELLLPAVTCGNGACEGGEDYKTCPADCSRPIWIPITWGVLIWLVVMGGIYWIWKYYAKKYDLRMQEKLFKQKSDYTTLVSFIAGELNKGTDGKAIRKELVDAGWKNDQIEYAMGKVLKQTLEFQRQTVLNIIIRETQARKIEAEIRGELKKAGWSDSLISYGFKKFSKMQRRKRF